MTASWKPGPLSQSCLKACRNSLPTIPLEKRVVDPSSEPGEIAAVSVRRYTRVAARDHDALVRAPGVGRHVERESSTAITFPGVQASVLTVPQRLLPHSFPRPSEGARPPSRRCLRTKISNLTVGKPIAISLAATGAMPNVGGTPKVRRIRPDRAAYPRPAPETRTAAGTRR